MKRKEIELYMDFAKRISLMSHAKRLKVGAVIVRDNGDIISYGYNGTPTGSDNCCEYVLDNHLVTKPEVLHAEHNAICKAARFGKSTDGAILIQTHSPCIECAKMILQSGIKRVIYGEVYRSSDGINFLHDNNVHCDNYLVESINILH